MTAEIQPKPTMRFFTSQPFKFKDKEGRTAVDLEMAKIIELYGCTPKIIKVEKVRGKTSTIVIHLGFDIKLLEAVEKKRAKAGKNDDIQRPERQQNR
jgi:hypothetical protein